MPVDLPEPPAPAERPAGPVHLRAGGASVLLDVAADGVPRMLHWGPDLGPDAADDPAALAAALTPVVAVSDFDAAHRTGLLPAGAVGDLGRPGLVGHRDGRDWSPLLVAAGGWAVVGDPGAEQAATLTAVDRTARLAVTTAVVLHPRGVLRVRHHLVNEGDTDYLLDGLEVSLPLPGHVTQVLDLAGRWCGERQPQRTPLATGSWVREGRCGRPGHDFPLAVVAMPAGTGFRRGEAWAVSLAWSGNHRHVVERLADGTTRVAAGELLLPGEVVLAPGESYDTPWLVCAYSAGGLDGISAAYHGWLRDRPGHPTNRRPRPLTLNTWEAVYFDHDLDRLRALADVAAEIGVERFVLDDGWFHGRHDDTAGLGDWWVDEQRWPYGLAPLIDHVRAHGMEFGLWVEPEMVNPDSELFRAHPDWVLHQPGRLPPAWRHQQVLDLAHPSAFALVLERLDALLRDHDIGYLKWDHNRVLVDAGHDGRPGVHAQTLAVYRLLDELRARHPQVEIESCASGGARVDLGILERTDRVWASDTNDALERQHIQRWTGLVLPPELVGAHIGPDLAHTTGRQLALGLRAATAVFGHAGLEWDLTTTSPAQRAELARWARFYRQWRHLLHAGTVVRADHPDPAAWVHGVVAADRAEAVFCYAQLATSRAVRPAPLLLPGLDPDRRYRLSATAPGGWPAALQRTWPGWTQQPGPVLSGRALAGLGLAAPILWPGQALLVTLRAAV